MISNNHAVALNTVQNAASWTYRSGLRSTSWGTTDQTTAVSWNGSTFVVGGLNGKIATSSDGATWTYQSGLSSTSWGTNTVNDITWNGTTFVAVGNNAAVATSSNGSTWTYRSGLNTVWGAVAASCITWNGTYFVVGGPTGHIARSTDGITWTDYTSNLTGTGWGSTQAVQSIIWTSNSFVVAGQGKVAVSADGQTWTYKSSLLTVWTDTSATSHLLWNGSQVFVYGGSGVNGPSLAYSTDTANYNTWSSATSSLTGTSWGSSNVPFACVWTGSLYVLGGQNSAIATSPTGTSSWTYRSGLSSTTFVSIGSGSVTCLSKNNSIILATGDAGAIATSP